MTKKKKSEVESFGDKEHIGKRTVDAPNLGKYWNADYLIGLVYRNGGVLPGGSGNVMKPEFYGCGLEQEEFLIMLTFYGALMYCAKKDPDEAELWMEEIGRNLIANYQLEDDEKEWITQKFINKKYGQEMS